MAKKVRAITTFIGSPDEIKAYGGGVPAHLKKLESKLTKEDMASFSGKITAGTEFVVSDKRAAELGLQVEVIGDADTDDDTLEGEKGQTNKHVSNVQEKVEKKDGAEKNAKAGPKK